MIRTFLVVTIAVLGIATDIEAQQLPSPLPQPLTGSTLQLQDLIGLSQIRTIQQAPIALRGRLTQLSSQRGAGLVHVARVSAQAITQAESGRVLRLSLAPGVDVSARSLALDRTDLGRVLWRGEVPGAQGLPSGMATLVVRGEDVTGTIRTPEGRVFQLRPLGRGETAVIELNYGTLPPDHDAALPSSTASGTLQLRSSTQLSTTGSTSTSTSTSLSSPSFSSVDLSSISATLRQSLTTQQTFVMRDRFSSRAELIRLGLIPTIDVLVAFTPSADTISGDIEALIELAIAETNDSFVNSNVLANVRLVGTRRTAYTEAGKTYSQILSDLRNTSDGSMDGLHSTRDSLRADVVVLITNQNTSCGRAFKLNAAAADAFAAAHWACATGNYTFGHELGHLIGTAHDRATNTNADFTYGHGFKHTVRTPQWRTIMAYDCTPSCPRIQFWSSPLTTNNGVAMGTAQTADNVRVWNERTLAMSRFR